MKVSVIIPALNEEKSIGLVLNDIPTDIEKEVIVVDNGCTDKTAEIAKEHGAKIVYEKNKGYGYACLKGLEYVNNSEIVVFLDADYSDNPLEMSKLIKPVVDNEADLVISSRILGNCEKNAITPQSRFGNWLATNLIYLFTGFKYTDLGPFRAIRWKSLQELDMKDKTYGWNVEMQIKAIKHNLRIKEVPVSYKKRIGKSKISGTLSGTIKAGYKIISTILSNIIQKEKHK